MHDSTLAAQGHGAHDERKRYEQRIPAPVANGIYIRVKETGGGNATAAVLGDSLLLDLELFSLGLAVRPALGIGQDSIIGRVAAWYSSGHEGSCCAGLGWTGLGVVEGGTELCVWTCRAARKKLG